MPPELFLTMNFKTSHYLTNLALTVFRLTHTTMSNQVMAMNVPNDEDQRNSFVFVRLHFLGKQPASSMAPIILLNANGQPVLATGGAGGVSIVPSVISVR